MELVILAPVWSNRSNCIACGTFSLITTASSLHSKTVSYCMGLLQLICFWLAIKLKDVTYIQDSYKALFFTLYCKIFYINYLKLAFVFNFNSLLYWNTKFCVFLQGVKAVLAESYEKVHKSQLIGIGIAPLQFLPGENPNTLGLTGREQFSILFPPELSPGMTLDIKVFLQYFFNFLLNMLMINYFLCFQSWWLEQERVFDLLWK